MATLAKLLKGRRKLGRDPKAGEEKLKHLGFGGLYLEQNKRLLFRAEYASSSDNRTSYKTVLAFSVSPLKSGVKASDKLHLHVKVKSKAKSERFVDLEKPKASKTKCLCYCECVDYIVTWWYANSEVGAHVGPAPASPEVLEKYRARGTGASKNPDGVPGMCKHLNALSRKLVKDKYVL